MEGSNKYWNLPVPELRVLLDERIILLKDACYKKDWKAVRKHDFELQQLIDAIFAQTRRKSNG